MNKKKKEIVEITIFTFLFQLLFNFINLIFCIIVDYRRVPYIWN